jgi:curved DNA-binding protein CbpA
MDDAYEVLQVHPKADLDVIRAAFRTLARKYHPDFGGTGARMVALNEAWNTIGDPKRRKAYDAKLAAVLATTAAATAAAARPSASTSVPVMRPTDSDQVWQPPARTGTVLDFGRYAGWSIVDLARQDPYYLEWLERTPIGRPLRSEIQELLGVQRAAATAVATATKPRQRRGLWGR